MKHTGEQRTSIRIAMLMSMAGLALALSAAPDAGAALIVYGSPTYTPGVGGFQSGDVPVIPGSGVNTAGTAVGYADRYDASGAYKGFRAVRWGAGATELGNLGTDTSGVTEAQAYAINSAGTAAGYADKYDGSGTYFGNRAVRWDASGTAATELGNLGTTGGLSGGFTGSQSLRHQQRRHGRRLRDQVQRLGRVASGHPRRPLGRFRHRRHRAGKPGHEPQRLHGGPSLCHQHRRHGRRLRTKERRLGGGFPRRPLGRLRHAATELGNLERRVRVRCLRHQHRRHGRRHRQ